MKKIISICLSLLVIAACNDPFDATSLWDKLNEIENKINDIENGTNSSVEVVSNKIYYTTSDGNKLFPKNTEPVNWGAILVSNIYENGVGVLTFDNGITSIPSNAFQNYADITSITIPNNVTSIGANAFYGCENLKTVTNNSKLKLVKGKTNNGYIAFYADKVINTSDYLDFVFNVVDGINVLSKYKGNATKLVLPDNYYGENYKIGNSAFSGCSGLKSILIPNCVTSIGDKAFDGCSNLKTVINFSNMKLEKGSTDNGYVAYYAKVVGTPITSISELNSYYRYYILTERGAWSIDNNNKILSSNSELGIEMDMNDAYQQFIIYKENNNEYLYNPIEECYINKNRSMSPTHVDAIYFKEGDKYATFVVYFDNIHYVNINSYNNLVIDNWKTPDAGNSCYIIPID